eukprot:COSAG04_NODE_8126_length_1020_cov_1.244300_3_plen_59_part_01
MEWSEGPCSAGPGIVAAGVWGLTVSSNYYEANNHQQENSEHINSHDNPIQLTTITTTPA